MPTVDVRPADPADFEALSVVAAAAYTQAYADYWLDPAEFARWLQQYAAPALRAWAAEPGVRVWIAHQETTPVGYLGLRLPSSTVVGDEAGTAELERFYLLSKAAGAGLGCALLACAETAVRLEGASAIRLKVMTDSPARVAYQRWGFRAVGQVSAEAIIPAHAIVADRRSMTVMRKDVAA